MDTLATLTALVNRLHDAAPSRDEARAALSKGEEVCNLLRTVIGSMMTMLGDDELRDVIRVLLNPLQPALWRAPATDSTSWSRLG